MAMRLRAATIFLGLLLPPSPLMAQQLFPNGAGWYRESGYRSTAAQRRLYWTSDCGAHWQDITPPIPDRYQLGQIFFLDRSRGWVFLVPFCGARNGFANPDPHAKVKIAITADSGKSWTTIDVGLPDYARPLSLGDGLGCVSFADAEHGWARIGFADPQGAYDLLLLATKCQLIAAIFRARVRRAMAGFMPLASNLDKVLKVNAYYFLRLGKLAEEFRAQLLELFACRQQSVYFGLIRIDGSVLLLLQ